MGNYVLENDELKITVSGHGAELASIRDQKSA